MLAVALTLVTGVLAVGVSWMALRRYDVFDVPNPRSSHGDPVLRGGGLGIGVALAVGLLATSGRHDINGYPGFVVALVGFALIGLVEDLRRNRPVAMRLGSQLLAGTFAALALVAGSDQSRGMTIFLVAVVLGWLVTFANAFNFMDGINGISGIEAAVIAGTVSVLALLDDDPTLATVAAVVAAGALSFLPYNFPRARLFMGDVGSYLLGAGLAALAVLGVRAGIVVFALLAPFVPYLADTSVTLGRRLIRGERWWEPHRQHAYQRLVDAGWSHGRTVLLIGVVTAVCGTAGIIGDHFGGSAWVASAIATGGVTAAYLATPAWVARRSASGER